MFCCSISEIKHISDVLIKSEMFSAPSYDLDYFVSGTVIENIGLFNLIIKQVNVLKVN